MLALVLIEDQASGTQLIQELINEGLTIVKAVKPEGNKVMRLNAQTATIENGFVFLPREAAWLADYLLELTTFPSSRYDDQADSTAQALAWFNQAPPLHWVWDYYARHAALNLHRQGLSLEAIASQINRSSEQVRQWIGEQNKQQSAAVGPNVLATVFGR